MIDDELVFAHRRRALSPDRPVVRGVAQNPDVYFQGRETVNPYYGAAAARAVGDGSVRGADRTAKPAVRLLRCPDAERVLVLMGSGAEAARESIEHLNAAGPGSDSSRCTCSGRSRPTICSTACP